MRHRALVHTGRDQPGNMCDIGDHDRADCVPDRSEARKVDDTRIGRTATKKQFGLMFFGQRFDLIKVDQPVFLSHPVLHRFVMHSRNADLITVC